MRIRGPLLGLELEPWVPLGSANQNLSHSATVSLDPSRLLFAIRLLYDIDPFTNHALIINICHRLSMS